MSAEPLPITAEECVIRSTHRQKGRTEWLAPGQGAVRQLHYGRVILDAGQAIAFDTGGRETGLIALGGAASIAVASESFSLTPYDALYIPRDSTVRISAADGCDLAEVSAPVSGNYPLQFVRFAQVRQDPALHFIAGGANTTRDLNILIGRNVQAGRILAGVTFSEPGHWTSWPPHEHARMLEEAYLYINMPAPAWGIQLVYTDPQKPELAVVVREGDCVVMPAGYHPNVAAPGGSIGFLWMMAAHRETEDRQFGVVNVQPEYAAAGSGLEASQAGPK
ncbi:MAG: 5-deoxy-glucuronate isomerase [Bryobacteraceae bacterium]